MKNITLDENTWTEIIEPKSKLFDFKLKELWHYRDLILLLVRRDLVSLYKQTILGPLWFLIQPLLTSITYMIIFGKVANIGTGGVPPMVFYMAGTTLWNYFAECINKTATVFTDNASIFGKVYFPRLVMPISLVISNLIKFLIQLALFLVFWLFFYMKSDTMRPNACLFLIPFLVMVMAMLSLGAGMIISSLTTKYRDLQFLVAFSVQLLMYATPVIYPLSKISPKYAWIIKANPISSLIETFRYAFTGSGLFSWYSLGYSLGFSVLILFIGIMVFTKVERTFMDTV